MSGELGTFWETYGIPKGMSSCSKRMGHDSAMSGYSVEGDEKEADEALYVEGGEGEIRDSMSDTAVVTAAALHSVTRWFS